MRTWIQVNTRHTHLALEQFETSTSTRADVAELVLTVVLGDDSSSVTTTNDDSGTVGRRLDSGFKESRRTLGELRELEDTRGT